MMKASPETQRWAALEGGEARGWSSAHSASLGRPCTGQAKRCDARLSLHKCASASSVMKLQNRKPCKLFITVEYSAVTTTRNVGLSGLCLPFWHKPLNGERESLVAMVKARRGSPAPVHLDEVAALLSNHDGGGVRVSRDDGRQHGEVYHTQARHATHPARTMPRRANPQGDTYKR
ncbi:hypothetical protein E2C01_078408 [Portunus trituberculatus]|uniref:Uncharacterized protein n=1 Tax=Portunus trituberculatus TaxID=210409 RepID=A0A5B7IMI3_PORTR|nr:hypothetical protein [Portunus trituberculatus]